MKKLLITLALASPLAHAEFFDGNDLLASMTDSSQVNRAIAIGYIAGVSDSGLGLTHCAPTTASLKQVADVVRIALDASPVDRHKSADSLILRALKIAWPCANKKKGEVL